MSEMSEARRGAQLAEAVRSACHRAAVEAYEQAAADGLCPEGALEVALDAIRALDLGAVLESFEAGRGG
jgi:2-methylisocitrate lyase-like PEP mutase family enzyme